MNKRQIDKIIELLAQTILYDGVFVNSWYNWIDIESNNLLTHEEFISQLNKVLEQKRDDMNNRFYSSTRNSGV